MATLSGEVLVQAYPIAPIPTIAPDLTRSGVWSYTKSENVIVATLQDDPSLDRRMISPEPIATSVGSDSIGCFEELFEKVIVAPRSKDFGFVISQQQFAVDVWNTFRNVAETLQAISIVGDGGLIISDPFGTPLIYWPLQARGYTATIPAVGSAIIKQTATWNFGASVSGADLSVAGSRITMFSLPIDWSGGFKERISYLTEVLKSYSDAEQRRALRGSPRRGFSYQIVTTDARSAALLDSLLWGWQHLPYGIPIWPDATPLASDVVAGALSIPVDTTNKLFQAGGLCCIWQDPFTFEACSIVANGVTSNSIAIASPLVNNYAKGAKTLVFPVVLGRLKDDVSLSRYCSAGDTMDLDFDGEGSQVAPTFSGSLTQYKGFDVLEVAPNWKDNLSRGYKRSMVVLDSKTGGIQVDDKGGSPIVGTELPWFAPTHANIATLRAFLDKRKGQFAPFWMPTWDQDLVLAMDAASTDTGIRIQNVSYTRFFFPSPARRYLAFIRPGQSTIYKKVMGSVANGDGTETLTLDSAIGAALSAKTTTISFLTFCRLASDDVELFWTSSDFTEAVISTAEVPRECP